MTKYRYFLEELFRHLWACQVVSLRVERDFGFEHGQIVKSANMDVARASPRLHVRDSRYRANR